MRARQKRSNNRIATDAFSDRLREFEIPMSDIDYVIYVTASDDRKSFRMVLETTAPDDGHIVASPRAYLSAIDERRSLGGDEIALAIAHKLECPAVLTVCDYRLRDSLSAPVWCRSIRNRKWECIPAQEFFDRLKKYIA